MTVLNDLDRFHLVMDTIDRLPQTGDKGIYLKKQLKDTLVDRGAIDRVQSMLAICSHDDLVSTLRRNRKRRNHYDNLIR
jgi:hypothetical protein